MSFLDRLFNRTDEENGEENISAAAEPAEISVEAEMPEPNEPEPSGLTVVLTPPPSRPAAVAAQASPASSTTPAAASAPPPAPGPMSRPQPPSSPPPVARANGTTVAKKVADPTSGRVTSAVRGDTGKLWTDLEGVVSTNLGPKGQEAVVDGVSTKEDLAAVRAVFDDLTHGYMGQVRNLMLDVKWGEARAEWLSLCEPALRSLRRMAETIKAPDLCAALDGFQNALRRLQSSRGVIAGADRDSLLQAYGRLVEAAPRAFELEAERNRREPIIVQSLLRQVPGVEKVTIDKLYAAGLTSLGVIYQARPDEIAATTNVAVELAARIVELFQKYRGSGGTMAAPTASDEHRQLGTLLQELRKHHKAFEDAASAWTREALARKKELRRVRAATVLKIQVALARLGEVDHVADLEKLPFRRKIEKVQSYLDQVRSAA